MLKLVVLFSVVALAASSAIAPWGLGAHGLGVAGLGWGGLGVAGLGWGGVAAPLAAAPVLGAYNYRGPLSLAPGQPASILAADGRPLDTLSVNLDRAAHLTARAVDGHGLHLLRKRSAPLLGGAWSHTARIDLPAARLIAPAHVGALGVAPLGLRAPIGPVGLAAPWGAGAAWGHGAGGAWGPAAGGAWGPAAGGAWGHGAGLGAWW